MAFWIEIRCEGRHAELNEDGNIIRGENEDCASLTNSDIGVLVFETTHYVLVGKSQLEESAIKCGYKRTRRGWFCPSCFALNRHIPVSQSILRNEDGSTE